MVMVYPHTWKYNYKLHVYILTHTHTHKLQHSISEKDSTIAVLEMQLKDGGNQTASLLSQTEELHAQRGLLTQQLKVKVQERLSLFRKDSDEVIGSLAQQCQSCNKEQVCVCDRQRDIILCFSVHARCVKYFVRWN